MAKRLNKKVALIGTVVFLILFVFGLIVVQQRDVFTSKEKLIEDGDVAKAEGDYDTAATKYNRAKSRAKNDKDRLEIMIDKLLDLYLQSGEWPPLRGTWAEILSIDPGYLPVRYARLKYVYVIADSGYFQFWKDVEEQASEFLEIAESEGILNEDTAQWERPLYQKAGLVHEPITGADGVQRLGQYLYFLKGRAKLEMAQRGAVTDPDALLEEAISDLEKAQELDPTNTTVASQLARAFIVKGDFLASRGSFEEQINSRKLAMEILGKAVQNAPEDHKGHMNYLSLERDIALMEEGTIEKLKSFEQKYFELIEKFPQEPQIHSFAATYYRVLGASYLDKAIEEINKARQLDPNNVLYAVAAADTYNIKAALQDDTDALNKAISILNNALTLPGVQDTEGPQQNRHRNNKLNVYQYLGTVYAERLLDPDVKLTQEKRQQWLENMEEIVHHIEQIRGSGEDPTVMKWQGMLALAKGQRTEAIRELYTVYRRVEASNRMDTQLAYVLAKAFENTNELGAALEFFRSALRFRADDRSKRGDSIDRRKPSALLDLADVTLKLRDPQSSLMLVNYFEEGYGANSRSRVLKVRALSVAGEFDEAEQALEDGGIDSSEKIRLEAEMLRRRVTSTRLKLGMQIFAEDANVPDESTDEEIEPVDVNQLNRQIHAYNNSLGQIIETLIAVEPNSVSVPALLNVCKDYYEQNRLDKARNLANLYLQKYPENISVKSFLSALDMGQEISESLLAEIRMEFIAQIPNPVEKAFTYGMAYAQQNEPNEAVIQFNKVVEAFEEDKEAQTDISDEFNEQARIAAGFVFEHALRTNNWNKAKELIALTQKYNLDRFNGDFFESRYNNAVGEYEAALQAIEKCAELRPISSQVLLFRGQIKEELGRTHEAIADIKQAMQFNPLSGNISKTLALALYRRNLALGRNVTTDQFIEVKEATQAAIRRNPSDTTLQSLYAEYVSESEPEEALSLRQKLLKTYPSVNNAVLLANMAFDISKDKTDQEEKQALLEIAADAYEKALQMDPKNPAALAAYAQFCRDTGRQNEAETIISESQDEQLQWRYYIQTGQYDKAKVILDKLYAVEPQDEQLLMGLINIAEKTFNQEEAQKYTETLCEINDSAQNKLIQIQTYLFIGLNDEAQRKLESFREQNPQNPNGQLLSAWLLMRQGKLTEALDMINKTIENDQTNPRAWLLRGEINRFLGNSGQAIRDLIQSRSLDDNPETRIALAQAYLSANRTNDAITELIAIVDKASTPDRARQLLESIYKITGNNNLLGGFYSRMINQYPENMMWAKKAAAFSEKLGKFDTARRLYLNAWDTSIERNKPDISALDGYITNLIKDNMLQQALDVCAKYINSEFASVALVNMARAKAKMGNTDAAIEHFKAAADREQNNPNILLRILYVMYDTAGPAEVEQYCNQKLAENPDSIVTNYVLYSLAKKDGDYNKALGFIDKCLALSEPGSEDYINALFEKGLLLSQAYIKYSDNSYFEQAVNMWQQFLKERPNNRDVLNNLAYLLADNDKQLSLALEYAKRVVELSPDNAGFRDTYAYVLYKNSRFQEAAENVRAAIQLFETRQGSAPAEVYDHMGMILDALGQSTEAIGAFEKALELGTDTLPQENKERIERDLQRLRGY